MIQLYLCRHGETEENVAGILQGQSPGHLTAQGCEQAAALRDRLVAEGVRFDALLVSDLARTLHTAHIVNEGFGLPLTPCRLLRERDWGSLTGRRIEEVRDMEFPKDVETVKAMHERARQFLVFLHKRHDGETVLAIGHGLFNRVIRATLSGVTIRDIPRMTNGEVCVLDVPDIRHHRPTPTASPASDSTNRSDHSDRSDS
ncbi:MAG: histidine phosphatase family protein [Alloprevotella sp.]